MKNRNKGKDNQFYLQFKYMLYQLFCIMMIVYILYLLLSLSQPAKIFRLSTDSFTIFKPQDILISTLGNFRMQLIQKTCQMRVQQFNGVDYKIKGFYPLDGFKLGCTHLSLLNGNLATSHQVSLIRLKNVQQKNFNETTLVIDDLGVIRLTGFSKNNKDSSEQAWIANFRVASNYLFSATSKKVLKTDSLSFIQNERGWGFSARNGEFRIFRTDDLTKIIRYRYNLFQITFGKILDEFNLELHYSSLPGLTFQGICGNVRFIDFKFPLLFQINQYWPELRVLDQSGYEIISIRYPNPNCMVDLQISYIQGQNQCISWFCPQGTFQFKGQCVIRCPDAYYHQIKQNNKNKCVLVCQEFATVYQKEKVCICNNEYIQPKCIKTSKTYHLGCYCQGNSSFFNGYSCTSFCSLGQKKLTLPVLGRGGNIIEYGGICIKCPYKCLVCEESKKYFVAYLICSQCKRGYTLTKLGLCQKDCKIDLKLTTSIERLEFNKTKNSHFYQIWGRNVLEGQFKCFTNCSIEFCEKCEKFSEENSLLSINSMFKPKQQLSQICIQCARPMILHENTCLRNCPEGFILVPTSRFYFFCTPKQTRYEPTNESKILPKQPSNNKILDCPINYYFSRYQDCRKCPYGCTSCIEDSFQYIQCTSCSPSYFLMLEISQLQYCQRDTILTSCQMNIIPQEIEKYFDKKNKICQYRVPQKSSTSNLNASERLDKFYSSISDRNRCKIFDANCLICVFQSSYYCTFCKPDYFLYRNKCIPECPSHTIKYRRVCFPHKIQFCQKSQIQQFNVLVNTSQQIMETNGYSFFLPEYLSLFKVLDPIGNAFIYGDLLNKDLGSKISVFPSAAIHCTFCQPYYGINFYNQQCERCLQPNCIRCPNSIQNKCYICDQNYKVDQNSFKCVQKAERDKKCRLGQFRNESEACVDQCKGFWLKNDNNFINCSRYCQSQNKLFINSSYLISFDQKSDSDYLVCSIVEQKIKNQKLSILSTFYKISDSLIYILIVPLESKFSIQPTQNQKLISLYQLQNFNGQIKYSQKKINQLHHIQVNPSKICLIFKHQNNKLLAIRFNIKKLHGRWGNSEERIKKDRLLFQSNWSGKKLFMPQSEIIYTPQDTPRSIPRSAISVIILIIILLIAIYFITQQILYKIDNLLIFLQTLALFALSINVKMLDTSFFSFFLGFQWSIGIFTQQFSGKDGLKQVGSSKIYIQNPTTTSLQVALIDGNFMRNCTPLMIGILITLGIYILIGFGCMKTQLLVFWRRSRNDQNLILQQDETVFDKKQEAEESVKRLRFKEADIIQKNLERREKISQLRNNTRFKQQELYEGNAKEKKVSQKKGRYKQLREHHRKMRNHLRRNKNKKNHFQPQYETPQTKMHTKSNEQAFLQKKEEVKEKQSFSQKLKKTKTSIKLLLHKLFYSPQEFLKYHQQDFNHFKKLSCFLIFLFETSTLTFTYFLIVTMKSDPLMIKNYQAEIASARSLSMALSWAILILIVVYSSLRLHFNIIAGIYMIKRFGIGIILGSSEGNASSIGLCVLVELLFTLLRMGIQQIPFILGLQGEQIMILPNKNDMGKQQQKIEKDKDKENGLKQNKSTNSKMNTNIEVESTENTKKKGSAVLRRHLSLDSVLDFYKKKNQVDKNKQNVGLDLNKFSFNQKNIALFTLNKYIQFLRPYKRVCKLLIQQFLIILSYILLSNVDNYTQAHINEVLNEWESRQNGNYYRSIGFFITLLIVFTVIMVYLAQFVYQIMVMVVQKWKSSGLGQDEKKEVEGLKKIFELKQYWQNEIEYRMSRSKQHQSNITPFNQDQNKLEGYYVQYLNQFYFQKVDPFTINKLRANSKNTIIKSQNNISNYKLSTSTYQYLF